MFHGLPATHEQHRHSRGPDRKDYTHRVAHGSTLLPGRGPAFRGPNRCAHPLRPRRHRGWGHGSQARGGRRSPRQPLSLRSHWRQETGGQSGYAYGRKRVRPSRPRHNTHGEFQRRRDSRRKEFCCPGRIPDALLSPPKDTKHPGHSYTGLSDGRPFQ
jgi:hypothetical protein